MDIITTFERVTLTAGHLKFDAMVSHKTGDIWVYVSVRSHNVIQQQYRLNRYMFGKDFAAGMRREFRAWCKHHPTEAEVTLSKITRGK
jgi:hypothetical protein